MNKISIHIKDIIVSICILLVSVVTYYFIDQSFWLADLVLSITDHNHFLWPTLYFGTFSLIVTAIILVLVNPFKTNILIAAFIVGFGGMLLHINNYNFSHISNYVAILGNGFYLIGAIIAVFIKMKSNKKFNMDSGADAPPPVN